MSAEDCLATLSSLPGLVALGTLTTAQANAIRATCMAILQQQHQQRDSSVRQGAAGDALVEALIRHPDLADLLEPMLTSDQLARLLKKAQER